MIVYKMSEYMPEISVLDLTRASFNDLQDSDLWQWVETHLELITRKLSVGQHAGAALRFFMEERGPASEWADFMNKEGGALELVEWILESEKLLGC